MFKQTIRASLLAGAAIFMGSAAVMSATLVKTFDASSALNSYNNGHSVYLPRGVPGGSDFDFTPNGLFSIFDDGSATLTGTATSDSTPANSFAVSVNFQATTVGTTGPKIEFGMPNTSDWEYFSLTSGLLTGLSGGVAGYELHLTQAPNALEYPFQIGLGANGKNNNFGGSGWFFYDIFTGCDVVCSLKASGKKGDFNLDLEDSTSQNVPPVPVPAAGLLLPIALGALGFAGRRKRKAQSA